jgi:methylthioribose-1-phosphate isomerase
MSAQHDSVRALRWSDEGLRILDQRRLPVVFDYELCRSAGEVAKAIAEMKVRGAPAIGIAAAYGVVLAARERHAQRPNNWRDAIEADLDFLARSRPTAVNLFWALDRMRAAMDRADYAPVDQLLAEAIAIHEEDVAANRWMGDRGTRYLATAAGVLTHCNTGSLATGGYGTALGVIRSAWRATGLSVYATETRPWNQGARLTVWELNQDRIPATLIADSAAPLLMKSGKVQWVIVGADRIAANGDTANKIGTYAHALAARHHGVGFMVVAPMSTVDWKTERGADIEIEERDGREFLPDTFAGPDSVIDAWNPVFDVTPAELIDVIVTERGVVEKPTHETMRRLLREPAS